MGYFDGLTDAVFKRGADGRMIFYPNGIMGKGFVLESEQQYQEVRGFVKKFYQIGMPAIIVAVIIAPTWLFLSVTVVVLAWYFLKVKSLTKNLNRSIEKLKLSEAQANSARSHNYWMLVFFLVVCVLFVISGAFMMRHEPLMGGLTVGFFGICALAIGRMVRMKHEERRKKTVK